MYRIDHITEEICAHISSVDAALPEAQPKDKTISKEDICVYPPKGCGLCDYWTFTEPRKCRGIYKLCSKIAQIPNLL